MRFYEAFITSVPRAVLCARHNCQATVVGYTPGALNHTRSEFSTTVLVKCVRVLLIPHASVMSKSLFEVL